MSGLITLGETMGLLIPAEIGPLHATPRLRLSIAGAESNVAIGLRRLGGQATWIGRVGRDEIGDLVVRHLRAEDVSVRAVRDPATTGLMLKTWRTADTTRITYYRAGSAGSHLCPDDLDENAIAAAGVLHVTGITPALGEDPAAAVHAAIDVARSAGVTVSLDLNYRSALWPPAVAGPALTNLVRRADIVFAAEHEAALVVDQGEPEQMARQLTMLGPRQAIIKRGSLGCVAVIEDEIYRKPALTVRMVDTVGAGDAFVAGYLAEMLRGEPATARLATATTTGAFAVTVPGDWEGLPHREELGLLNVPDHVIR
jgi:2-dehydro-3-deoxygluconokinase